MHVRSGVLHVPRSCCVVGLAPDHRDLGHDKEANCELGITRAFDNFEIPRLIDAADMASNAHSPHPPPPLPLADVLGAPRWAHPMAHSVLRRDWAVDLGAHAARRTVPHGIRMGRTAPVIRPSPWACEYTDGACGTGPECDEKTLVGYLSFFPKVGGANAGPCPWWVTVSGIPSQPDGAGANWDLWG